MTRPPDYAGGSLVNLIAEVEFRLTGTARTPRLHPEVAAGIPDAPSYVIVLFDGLGADQLQHPAAGLAADMIGRIDAPFPTTTTVSLATVATGLPPSQHGLLGYQLWMPNIEQVVNTIKWTTLWGEPLDYDTNDLLPTPNLWERLTSAGIEPITVQPGHFAGSPLTQALYRGCRFEPVFTVEEVVSATIDLAAQPGRLLFTYVPHVDFAAHVYGQDSREYVDSLEVATGIWEGIAHRLPAGSVMIGTADHGHVDFPEARRVRLPKEIEEDRILYGDSRAMFVKGAESPAFADLPATWIAAGEVLDWWGPGPRHPAFDGRAPDGILLADDDAALLHSHSDKRLIGHHGALSTAEREVPLLVAGAD
ncbi:MAG: alkaline phosphatase family protein [Acidimicrobiia bacterium]|nr:alkaline phosphatase family protein [Acidimicrobiia bacterium]